jgi:hypothetical protein
MRKPEPNAILARSSGTFLSSLAGRPSLFGSFPSTSYWATFIRSLRGTSSLLPNLVFTAMATGCWATIMVSLAGTVTVSEGERSSERNTSLTANC